MTTTEPLIDGSRSPAPRAPWRSVAVPSEHGGWGLTLEPVLLGLLIGWSTAGLSLGLAAFVAFVARTPLKVVLVDRYRRRSLPRTALARKIVAIELVVLGALLAIGVLLSSGASWVPLLAASPLLTLELWFDLRSRSRRLVPELAGSIGIGSVAAAIVLAAGGSATLAASAWLVIAARTTASIPFVRYQLGRAKHSVAPRWASDLAQGVAVAIVAVPCALGWLPTVGLVAIALLAATQLVLARLPAPRATVVGVQQLVFGLVVVVAVALAL